MFTKQEHIPIYQPSQVDSGLRGLRGHETEEPRSLNEHLEGCFPERNTLDCDTIGNELLLRQVPRNSGLIFYNT